MTCPITYRGHKIDLRGHTAAYINELRVCKTVEIKRRLVEVLQISDTSSEERCYLCVSTFCRVLQEK